jgi:hydrogenase expression/formation protein HypE
MINSTDNAALKAYAAPAESPSQWTPEAVLFDFDGTLTRPGLLDFAVIRNAINCPRNLSILEYIEMLPPGEQREQCKAILHSFEEEAAELADPNEGAVDLLLHLKARNIPLGIITRNTLKSVLTSLRKFVGVDKSDFKTIITREDPVRPKPEPDGVLLAASRMGVSPERILVVGDYIFDIEAGKRAGSKTAFLSNGKKDCANCGADWHVELLGEIKNFCEYSGLVMSDIQSIPENKRS